MFRCDRSHCCPRADQTLGGGRIAVGPAVGRRRTLAGRRRSGQVGLGQGECVLENRPHHRNKAPGGLATPAGKAAEGLRRRRRGRRRRDDRAVRQQPSGGEVSVLSELIACLPQSSYDGQLPASAQPVDSARAPPRISPCWSRWRSKDRLELLVRPRQLALPLELAFQRVPQIDKDLHVQRRVGEPRLRQRPP